MWPKLVGYLSLELKIECSIPIFRLLESTTSFLEFYQISYICVVCNVIYVEKASNEIPKSGRGSDHNHGQCSVLKRGWLWNAVCTS